MTRIDQRILIPAAPQVVWEYIKQIDNLPDWQVNCETITYLSQKRHGPGTRWRQSAPNRHEFVYEMTTWYDGLGFEYVFIDGSSFQEARGRIRLQEIAEGTIVQWTFEYELGGVLSGLRDTLTKQRRIESDMVDSLKELWKQSRRKGGLEGFQAKSLMQDGEQDPEKRSQYTPRHERAEKPEPKQTAEVAAAPSIEEPPVSEDDTRPRPSVDPSVHLPEEPEPEQEAMMTTDDAPITDDDYARFAPPVTNTPSEPTESDLTADETITDEDATLPTAEQPAPGLDAPSTDTPEQPAASTVTDTSQDQPQTPGVQETDEPAFVSEPDEPPAPTEAPAAPSAPEEEPSETEPLEPKVPPGTDTSDLSIWEIFGIPSPTDTQKMRAVEAAKQAEREYEEEQITSTASPAPEPDTSASASTSDDITEPNRPTPPLAPDMPAVDDGGKDPDIPTPPAEPKTVAQPDIDIPAPDSLPSPAVDEPHALEEQPANHQKATEKLIGGRTGLRQQMRYRGSQVRHPQ